MKNSLGLLALATSLNTTPVLADTPVKSTRGPQNCVALDIQVDTTKLGIEGQGNPGNRVLSRDAVLMGRGYDRSLGNNSYGVDAGLAYMPTIVKRMEYEFNVALRNSLTRRLMLDGVDLCNEGDLPSTSTTVIAVFSDDYQPYNGGLLPKEGCVDNWELVSSPISLFIEGAGEPKMVNVHGKCENDGNAKLTVAAVADATADEIIQTLSLSNNRSQRSDQ